jgi:hypothetical protein
MSIENKKEKHFMLYIFPRAGIAAKWHFNQWGETFCAVSFGAFRVLIRTAYMMPCDPGYQPGSCFFPLLSSKKERSVYL